MDSGALRGVAASLRPPAGASVRPCYGDPPRKPLGAPLSFDVTRIDQNVFRCLHPDIISTRPPARLPPRALPLPLPCRLRGLLFRAKGVWIMVGSSGALRRL